MSNPSVTLKARASFVERLSRPGLPASVALLALVVFLPALDNEFVGWDDPGWISDNPHIRDAAGLKTVWTSRRTGSYHYSCPLTFTSFWLEYRLWGLEARGYHLTNVLLHGLNALLAWWLLRVLGAGRWASWVAAALFAVHPMQVQSVAWVTERKNTLSLALTLGSFLLYVRHRRTGRWAVYAWSLLLFTGAVLSKASAVILPVIFLWTEWVLGLSAERAPGRRHGAALLRTAPMFLIAAAITLLTMSMEDPSAPDRPPWLCRLLVAGGIPWFYLAKLIVPLGLMPLYPKWPVAPSSPLWWLPLIALAAAVVILLLSRRKLNRLFLWGLGMFLLSLLPMSGLAHYVFFEFSDVANHYVYMACIGLFISLAVLIETLGRRAPARLAARTTATLVALLAVGALAAQTWRRCDLWQNTKTILNETLHHYPDFWMAHASLGDVAVLEGDYPEALQHYRRSLQLNPRQLFAHCNLAALLAALGQSQAAIDSYRQAIALHPKALAPRINLGNLFARLQRFEEAVELYRRTLEIEPDRFETLFNLSGVLFQLGRYTEAADALEQAHRLRPDHLDTVSRLALLLATNPRAEHCDGRRALCLARSLCEATQYRSPQALDLLACAQARAGQFPQARASARRAIQLVQQNGPAECIPEFQDHLRAFAADRPFGQPPAPPPQEMN